MSSIQGTTILTPRSNLIVAVTSPGRVGRFKVYSVRPPGVLLAVHSEGCISPTQQAIAGNFAAHLSAIDQSPCSGLLLPADGAVIRASDPVTVTYRMPAPLPPGKSWVLAIESNTKQAGCVNFDAQFFAEKGRTGQLLTATLRPEDALSIPTPLPKWCLGPFATAAFTFTRHDRSVRTIAARVDGLTVLP